MGASKTTTKNNPIILFRLSSPQANSFELANACLFVLAPLKFIGEGNKSTTFYKCL